MGFFGKLFNRPKPPLELTVIRNDYGKDYTGGQMLVLGMIFGDTIEPPSRHLTNNMLLSEIKAKKVYGKTAIPTGRYKIEWKESPSLKNRSYAKQYGGKFPYLIDVPGWSGVMIHPFNYGTESKGCIAVGEKWMPGKVINATRGYQDLMDHYLVPAFKAGQEVYITIVEK